MISEEIKPFIMRLVEISGIEPLTSLEFQPLFKRPRRFLCNRYAISLSGQRSSATQDFGPTMPSLTRPSLPWKPMTAALVAGPKMPSTLRWQP